MIMRVYLGIIIAVTSVPRIVHRATPPLGKEAIERYYAKIAYSVHSVIR